MSPPCSDDLHVLIRVARHAIVAAIEDNCLPEFPSLEIEEEIEEPRTWPGIFVTLYHGGRLRGCVGQVESVEPPEQLVARIAVDAALHDPRFSPVVSGDLQCLQIEVSVLSALERVGVEAIAAGLHGIVVQRGERRAVLLPQVALERKWTAQRFVEEACVKAGLHRDSWEDSQTQLYAFTVRTLTESDAST